MKRWIHAASEKNTSGGEILDKLRFGNISVVYETYQHSGLQKRIVITAGSQLVAVATHVDNAAAFEQYWEETRNYLDSLDTSGGEAGYYKYHDLHAEVKKELVNILNKYKPSLTEGSSERVNQFSADNEFARTTRRDKLQFGHDVIFSIQFFDRPQDAAFAAEIFILAQSYAEAREVADDLADERGYDPDECMVQYAFTPVEWWDQHAQDIEKCDRGHEFIEVV